MDHFLDAPSLISDAASGLVERPTSGSAAAAVVAVNYVATMTDRYAMNL